jgi:hypothetical protein
MNFIRQRFVALLFISACASSVDASQFYVFPVKEIEGVGAHTGAGSRPLVDPRVRSLLGEAVQRELATQLTAQIAAAYPESAVHAAQVREARRGAYRHIDDDSLVCGTGFTVSLTRSYAAVLGVTRASWYEVPREGDRVELLLPITLSLQFVKPDGAKVAYAISETLYSPFSFSRAEMGTEAMTRIVSERVLNGLRQQVAALVQAARTGFQPKETPVRMVGRAQGVLVADQGFEIGFRAGDELEAVHRANGSTAVFKVLSVDSGYSVLRTIQGEAAPGDEFSFLFAEPADDSRKPRVLPLTSEDPGRAWTNAVAEVFGKSVGMRAAFQLTPVDVHFQGTLDAIRRQARCAAWDKVKSAKQISDNRTDAPDYFLRFEMSRSPVATQAGLGGVKTADSFITAVAAQVVDRGGNVLFSEIAHDGYRLERTAGQGLSLAAAQEISLKNATIALAQRFVDNVRFTPGEFQVSAVGKDSFAVTGLSLPPDAQLPAYEVLRPLGVQVRGRPAFWRLALDEGTKAPVSDGRSVTFSYSRLEDAPRPGDVLRVRDVPRGGQTRMSECREAYRAPQSAEADYLLPLVRHAAYRSGQHLLSLHGDDWTGPANQLLEAGFFRDRVTSGQPTEVCMRPGYAVRVEPGACTAASCTTRVLAATTLIQERAGERVANAVQAETLSLDGFTQSQAESLVGLRAYESVLKNLSKLTARLNPNK